MKPRDTGTYNFLRRRLPRSSLGWRTCPQSQLILARVAAAFGTAQKFWLEQAGRQASRASSRPRFLPSFLRHSRTTYSPRSPSHATTPPPSSAPAGRGGGRAAARSPDTLTKGQARTIVSNSLTSAGECATAGSLRVPFFFSFPSCSTCSATRSNEYTFRL